MRNYHLSEEEIIALNEGGIKLLQKWDSHLNSCDECMNLMSLYEDSKMILKTGGNITPIIDPSKIDAIAARSFSYLEADVKEEKSSFFETVLNSLFSKKAVFALAMSLMILAVSAFLFNNYNQDKAVEQNLVAEVDSTSVETEKPAEKITSESKGFESITEKYMAYNIGDDCNSHRANIQILSKSYLKKFDDNNISIEKGKIDVSVQKGEDFFIHIGSSYLVRVLGTRFIVEADDKSCKVTVIEGLVELIDKDKKENYALSKNMSKKIEYKAPKPLRRALTKRKIVKTPKTEIEAEEPVKVDDEEIFDDFEDLEKEESYLLKGRAALREKKYKSAYRYFKKELKKGEEKDKALFEIVRLMEKKKKYKELLGKMDKYRSIILSGTVYKEEFLIKGCKAEAKLRDKSFKYCKRYLKYFPEGYKKEEIKNILGKK